MRSFVVVMVAGIAALHGSLVQADEVYGQIGTEGLGIGYAHALGLNDNVRAEFNGLSLSDSLSSGDLHYNGKLNLAHGGLYADFFPAPSLLPFRVSAGMLVGGDNVEANATSSTSTFTFNGVTISTLGETVHARAKFPVVRPYLGIGLGHTPTARKGFSMFCDAGVAYGTPRLDFDVPANVVAEAGEANVDAEKQQLQDKLDKLRFYPVVKVGVTYRF